MTNRHRYINIAIIHQDGCTSSSQVWTNDPSEAMKAFEQLTFDAYRKKNPAVLGLFADPDAPIVRYNILDLVATIIKVGAEQ